MSLSPDISQGRSRIDGRRITLCLPLLLSLLLAPGPRMAWGQGIPTDTVAPDTIAPISLPGLEVRVLRSPMDLNMTPLAVSFLNRATFSPGETGVFLRESLSGLPGLQIQNRFNFAVGERLSVRGQGSRAQFGVRSLQVFLDEIPATMPDGQSTLDHLDLTSLGRVELLRGPASALYGNGSGGVLRFETRTPSSLSFQEELSLVAGGHGLVRLSSLSHGTLGSTGYLLSMGWTEFGGYRADPVTGGDPYGEAWRKNLLGRVSHPLAGGDLRLSFDALDLDSENPGSLTREQMVEEGDIANPFNVVQKTGKAIKQGQLGLSWSGSVPGGKGMLAGFGILRNVDNPIPPAVVDLDRIAGGLRGSLSGERHRGALDLRWKAGAEAGIQKDKRRNFRNDQGAPGEATLNQEETVLSSGLFVQGLLRHVSGATLLSAIRYQRTSFEAMDFFQGPEDPDDSGTRDMDAFSPSMGISVPLREGVILRTSFSTLFQTPTTTELANRPSGSGGFNPEVEPEKGWTVEAGLRFRLGYDHVEITLFDTHLSRELVPFEVPEAPGRVFFRNAGQSRYRGAELATELTLGAGFRFRGSYNLLDARFREYAPSGEDYRGNKVPGAPRHSLDARLTWEGGSPLRGIPGFATLRGMYRGEVPVDDANSDAARPFLVLDLRVGMESLAIGRFSLYPFLGVDNLLDRVYTTSVSVNAFGGRYFDPGPPRSAYLGLRAVLDSNGGRDR